MLDSINLDTPRGRYEFTPETHHAQPDSASVVTVVKDRRFVPASLSDVQLAALGLQPADDPKPQSSSGCPRHAFRARTGNQSGYAAGGEGLSGSSACC